MGIFGDIGRLMKAGAKQSANTDYAANLKHSADLAEQYAGYDPNTPSGTHGAATANAFTNMAAFATMRRGSGTVVSLAPTGAEVEGTPVYVVELDLKTDGQDAYRTSYQTLIADSARANWQPGSVLPFRVSPEDPHSLMLG
ncbi:hypothetical protein [Microbacterium sp. WCS2018Hpa-23]|uniref:hypothetical protein n=1 Tax=Microbacterium sp. WCS2018Hpa-23 TaxID=3073634 RepID=UPI0028832363|nr:hypothetical protein [Microbacterium sp. WCS2018Hpa-23]